MKRGLLLPIMTMLIALPGITAACAADTTGTPATIANEFDDFGAVPWELPDDAVKMAVDSVHDGDSLKLTKPNDDWWEEYRIIGIQAPEIDGYRKEECYGQESADFLKALLPKGTEVYIQQDIANTDRNDRFLRHIFIVDEQTGDVYLLSEVLVLGGYARARPYPPDDLYDDILQEAQDVADARNVGLWDACTS